MEPYVESRGIKVSVMKSSSDWRHKYNKENQWIIRFSYVANINIFGYLGAWGGGGFNNQTGPS